ncbi:MAG: chemotaxis response regulator protein-glutamate methylesterase [bacterium]
MPITATVTRARATDDVKRRTRVLIVDDSALMRRLLTEILGSARDLEVVGTASDPFIARDKIKELDPDVLTLDVEMPRMDGLKFLSNLMRLRPMPVVMVSSLTEKGADVTLEALSLGAVDFVSKPKIDQARGLEACAEEIIAKVRSAAGARVTTRDRAARAAPAPIEGKLSADAVIQRAAARGHFRTTDRVIAIGASTGGTEAIREVLDQLPADAPGILISQHIPEAFSGPFARRLDTTSPMSVREAEHGQQVLPGHVYIAPGHSHLLLRRNGAQYVCELSDGPPVNRHRPSVDVMFRSVAQSAGPNAIGVILTGMGADGAQGLLEMRENGAKTLAQDQASSVVWGMPGEAVKRGAVDAVVPLSQVARSVLALVR